METKSCSCKKPAVRAVHRYLLAELVEEVMSYVGQTMGTFVQGFALICFRKRTPVVLCE